MPRKVIELSDLSNHSSESSESSETIANEAVSSETESAAIKKGEFTEELIRRYMTLSSGGGGGGNLEARVAKLEASVHHIQNDIADIKFDIREIKKDAKADFTKLFGALIFVALGLAGLIAKGFDWI